MHEDEKPKTEADAPTPNEQKIEGETGTSGEEAHRIGEFDDLRDRLERIENALGNITSTLVGIASTLEAMRTTASAIDIDNGADVVDADGDGDGDADVIDDGEAEIPDYEDMDLDL